MGAPCISWAFIFHDEAISTLPNALKPAAKEAASGLQKEGFIVGERKVKNGKVDKGLGRDEIIKPYEL